MSRAFRYYKKGYSVCLGEMKKLVESIRDMPKPEPEKEDENEEEKGSDELFRVSKDQIIWGGNYFTDYLKPTRAEFIHRSSPNKCE